MRKTVTAALILLALGMALVVAVGSATANDKDKEPKPTPTAEEPKATKTAEPPKSTDTPEPPKPTKTPEEPKPTATEKPPHDKGDDLDDDGCTTEEEKGQDPAAGGQRDPKNHWDFYDTPNPKSKDLYDRDVDIDDLLAVAGRFAAQGDPGGDPLAKPAEYGYHTGFDRGQVIGSHPWNLSGPDGTIAIDEIFWVAAEFAHQCVAPK